MIEECRYGIHDLSRLEGYPRFNMSFELGVFVGAKRYGRGAQDRKDYLVFERNPNTYDRFISDFSGHDIKFHKNQPRRIAKDIRDWLSSVAPRKSILGIDALWLEYGKFQRWLPGRCRSGDLTWGKVVELAIEWTKMKSEEMQRLT
jgi:hypothetical protein